MTAAPDFSSRPARRWRPRETLLLLAALALLALSATQSWEASRRRAAGEAALAALRAELEDAGARVRALERRHGSGPGRQAVLTAQAPPARVLAELTALLPSQVRLTDLGLVYRDRLELEIQLAATSAEAYDAFLERLAGSPLFEGVVPGPESRDSEARASLRVSYRGGER